MSDFQMPSIKLVSGEPAVRGESLPGDGQLHALGESKGEYFKPENYSQAIDPKSETFSVTDKNYFNKDAAEMLQPSANAPIFIPEEKPNPIAKILVFGFIGFVIFKFYKGVTK